MRKFLQVALLTTVFTAPCAAQIGPIGGGVASGMVSLPLPSGGNVTTPVASIIAALPSGYSYYILQWSGVQFSSYESDLGTQISVNGGSSYITSGYNDAYTYNGGSFEQSDPAFVSNFSATNVPTGFSVNGQQIIYPGAAGTPASATSINGGWNGVMSSFLIAGYTTANGPANFIKILDSKNGNNLIAGSFRLWGVP